MAASQVIRVVVIVLCFQVLSVSSAIAKSTADRYEMRVGLDPARARIAVSGVVMFPTPVPASGAPLLLSLGRGMVSPSLEVITAGSPAGRAVWSVVDSTEEDFVWSAPSPGPGPIAGVRFSYEASSPEPRYFFYVGSQFALAEAGAHSWYPRRPDTRASGEIGCEVPPGWSVVATGVRTSSANDESRGKCRFSATFASELWFVAAQFSSYRLDGPVPLTVYTVSPDVRASFLARRASQTLGALRGIFGRFPFPALSLIEVPSDVAWHYRVLHWTDEYAAEAAALVPDTRSRLMLQEGRTADAETLLVYALAKVAEPDVYGARFMIANTLARLAEGRRDWKSAAALTERAIASPSRRADILPFTYVRLARVSAELGRWERVAFAARAAPTADAAAVSQAVISEECQRLLSDARRHGVK